MKNIFKDGTFTKLFSLSKTLRFELKPQGRTLENMRKNLRYDGNLLTFLADQEIEDAYQTLKPIFDFLHEKFITQSLQSKTLQAADFSEYLRKYRVKKDLKDKDFEPVEKKLRAYFEKAYEDTAEIWKQGAGKSEKDKPIFTENSFSILTEKGILDYINKNKEQFVGIKSDKEIDKALASFEGFFTYFGGFNQNRENYYETGKEAATAVATRIVHENLPKFCDNILFFEDRSNEYRDVYNTLRSLSRSLVNKEGDSLLPIDDDLFTIKYFSKCFSQKQIEEYNDLIGNANFLINLYNQANNEDPSFQKLSFFKTLYKQIGCGKRDSLFFSLAHDRKSDVKKVGNNKEEIFSVEEVLELADKAGKKYFQRKSIKELTIATVPDFLTFLKNRENYLGVYWSKVAINTVSNKYFANWHDIKDKLKEGKVFGKANKGSEDTIKVPEAVELEGFFKVLNQVENWKETLFKTSINADKLKKEKITQSNSASQALLALISCDIAERSDHFLAQSSEVLTLTEYKSSKNKEAIKSWLDDALAVSQMLKYFLVRENKVKGTPLDSTISQGLRILLQSEDAEWFKWYDALRNYLTKKPQDDIKVNKLKLNFENTTLGAGWDINKESDNYCVIFQDLEGRQFLSIIARQEDQKGFNKVFEKNESNLLYKINGKEGWRKMEYKLLPGPNKMLPKCLIPRSDRGKYGATNTILSIYDSGSFKKNEANFSIDDLYQLINFYKSALKKYKDWQGFNFSFSPTLEYRDIGQFYSDVEKQGYKIDFIDISKKILDELVEDGKVYLFEIKSQDSNGGKKKGHKNNLHTIYWQALFQDILNRPKLNGGAEIFYRKALSSEKLEKIKDKVGKERIKSPRFSKEKFLFHVPIKLNFGAKNENLNVYVNKVLSSDNDTYFLGIDRGEKHLAYYSLINKSGLIMEQGTLNMPLPNKIKIEKRTLGKDGKESIELVECNDYNDLLEARAGDRDYARKNWQTIGTIEELKRGYISQVVRKIADLAVEHNAFIVLEDLNTGFKRGRQKIEKSVYQKLELALAKKLNFLVDKSAKNGEVGSVTNAVQLTPLVSNYGDIEGRKQVGIMLYARANYTSQTDPVTGWRKSIYLKAGSEKNIKDQIMQTFSNIGFDGKDYYFDYTDEGTKKIWRLYSGKNSKSLDRFKGKRDNNSVWVDEPQNVMEILGIIFEKFDKSRSFFTQIKSGKVELTRVNDKHTAWESLRFAIEMIQQIRNTGIVEKDNDFILSPVRDERDNHFDSRKATNQQSNSGDANGAYNIARKGIVMNEHIKRGYTLFIADAEWDAWLAGKDVWEKWLQIHEKEIRKRENYLT